MAKLRAILLLELDFNRVNKIICNSRVFPRLEAYRDIPYEVIGDIIVQSSQHVALNKKLMRDIGNQTRRPTVVCR